MQDCHLAPARGDNYYRTMQLVIPMSGQGTRFQKAGFHDPKPLVRVGGVPMIERLLEAFPKEWPCTFVIAENHKMTSLESVLKRLRPQAEIVAVPKNDSGPWLAISAAIETLNTTEPIFISYCDYGMKWDAKAFEEFTQSTSCDACIVSYRGFHAHYLSPLKYAYSRLEGDRVKEVREKGSFTENRESEFASCGAYFFKNVAVLKSALEYQKQHDLNVNGEFYTSLTVEALLRSNPTSHVRVFELEEFYQWGTPEDLNNYEYWETTYLNDQTIPKLKQVVTASQLVLPMAGRGSRLATDFKLPKPLIPIDKQPMYIKALQTFPTVDKTVIVTLPDIAAQILNDPSVKIVTVPQTPAGQALTTELALEELDERDVIVTACDHGIVLAPKKWQQFIIKPDCDAAVFTITGYPGVRRNPTFFSYVSVEKSSDPYAIVKSVGLKKPFTSDPATEPLLTGSFWFSSKAVLKNGITALKATQHLNNGELYLDSIFNILLDQGMKVRQIPLDGYMNWGDADSFKETQYWNKIFSKKISK